jgi:hypothetical protein
MSNTLKFGNGQWAVKEGSTLAYNDENNNYKPLPFTTTRESRATRVNKEGLIEVVGNDVPRIDYTDNAEGVLLLEPSRTNLQTYSSDLASIYNPTNITQTSNYGISPDGTLNSTRIVLSNLTDSRSADTFTGVLTSGTTYTFSCYYKGIKGETTYMNFLKNPEGIYTFKEIVFTGEWQRESITFTAGSASNYTYIVDARQGVSTATDFEVFGAQVEQGSYATSYIPTQGGAVTRLADSCNNGGNEQVINSTEGVLYAEISALANDLTTRIISLSDNTTSNRILIKYDNIVNRLEFFVIVAGIAQYSFITTVDDLLTYNKIALKYKTNDFQVYLNGIELDSSVSGNTISANTLTTLKFQASSGTSDFYGNVKDVRLYNTALTDQELQVLTQV